jgi:hypothetical protein
VKHIPLAPLDEKILAELLEARRPLAVHELSVGLLCSTLRGQLELTLRRLAAIGRVCQVYAGARRYHRPVPSYLALPSVRLE